MTSLKVVKNIQKGFLGIFERAVNAAKYVKEAEENGKEVKRLFELSEGLAKANAEFSSSLREALRLIVELEGDVKKAVSARELLEQQNAAAPEAIDKDAEQDSFWDARLSDTCDNCSKLSMCPEARVGDSCTNFDWANNAEEEEEARNCKECGGMGIVPKSHTIPNTPGTSPGVRFTTAVMVACPKCGGKGKS